MAIGQNTFWIIVNIPDGEAMTSPKDRRVAVRFVSEEAAETWRRDQGLDPNFFIVVKVPA